MNKEQIKNCVCHSMLWEAREKITRASICYEKNLDATYLDRYGTIVYNRRDIAKAILDENGINPLNFDDVKFESTLDIFAGVFLDGDNPNGEGLEWFEVEVMSDSSYLIGRYHIRTEL